LDYSRIDASDEREDAVIDAGRAVRTALHNLQPLIERTGAEIEVAALPRVRFDPALLPQIFQNLLENALKFRGDRPLRVRIGARRAGDFWEITVQDDGIGIHSDQHEQIFELFHRLRPEEEVGGSG